MSWSFHIDFKRSHLSLDLIDFDIVVSSCWDIHYDYKFAKIEIQIIQNLIKLKLEYMLKSVSNQNSFFGDASKVYKYIFNA